MSCQYDYFISYASEDDEKGFVDRFVKRLADAPGRLGAKPRVFFQNKSARGEDDGERANRAEIDAARYLVVFLSSKYFQSKPCAAEFKYWLESEERRSLPNAGIALIQIEDVLGLFDNGKVFVPEKLQESFPDWVAELRKLQVYDDFDLRIREQDSVDAAIAALCRACLDDLGALESAPVNGSCPKGDPANPDELQALREKLGASFCSGNLARERNQRERAREHFANALDLSAQILAIAPDDFRGLVNLRGAYDALGNLSELNGDYRQAMDYYAKGLEVFEKIVADDPFDLRTELVKIVSYSKLGDLAFADGEREEAEEYYKKSRKLRDRYSLADPNDLQPLRDMVADDVCLGDFAKSEGRNEQAKKDYEKALETSARILERTPDDLEILRAQSAVCKSLSELLDAEGKSGEARERREKASETDARIAALEASESR